MDEFSIELVLGAVIFILGLVASIIYYFARYYFQTHEQDHELAPDLTPNRKPKELHEVLKNTRRELFGRIKTVLKSHDNLNDDLGPIEEVLYTSDLGPQTVQRLLSAMNDKLKDTERNDPSKVREALRTEMLEIFSGLETVLGPNQLLNICKRYSSPCVFMIVGVNGAGKTTTIGKMANYFALNGLKTMVVAGDTFRAAAGEQLSVWSQRAKVEIFHPQGVTDPSAVAFDGLTVAKSKGFEVVIVDTAGRLHTQVNLMEELKKMKRVMQKVIPEAPQEVFIVLDANSGQNALVQAQTFHEALNLTGAILTKLDGTAKGGVAVGLACELKVPIQLIGVGEGVEDLRPFNSKEFVDSIL